MTNARIAKALRSVAEDCGGEALIRQQSIARKLVEYTRKFDRTSLSTDMSRELASQLGAAMVTAR